jgi:hypothetical protein
MGCVLDWGTETPFMVREDGGVLDWGTETPFMVREDGVY